MFQDEELTVGALLQNKGDLEKELVKPSRNVYPVAPRLILIT
jgi:hypothetical protein